MFTTGSADFSEAPCVSNPEPFLSVIEHTGARKVQACKVICASCPLTAECLPRGYYESYVLPGVYGGLDQAERAALDDAPEDWIA